MRPTPHPAPDVKRDFPVLDTQRLRIRLGEPSDAEALVSFFRLNNPHFAKTQNPRRGRWLSQSYVADHLRLTRRDFRDDRSCQLLILPRDESKIIGTANFTSFVRGYFQACHLGYLLAEAEQGKGLMTEALRAAIDYVFLELDMHRIMASYVPSNERSGRVLARLGFQIEGRAPAYLRINGIWQDHILTALSNPSWRGDLSE